MDIVSLSKTSHSAFNTSSYSETKINRKTRCFLFSNPHQHHSEQKSLLFILLPCEGSKLNSAKACLSFHGDPEKLKGARGLEIQSHGMTGRPTENQTQDLGQSSRLLWVPSNTAPFSRAVGGVGAAGGLPEAFTASRFQ